VGLAPTEGPDLFTAHNIYGIKINEIEQFPENTFAGGPGSYYNP
jgi:hypothetical protein